MELLLKAIEREMEKTAQSRFNGLDDAMNVSLCDERLRTLEWVKKIILLLI